MARLITVLAALALLVSACKPNPADCYEKGDEQACNAICETGEDGSLMACYELRARQVEACAAGKGDCKTACELWQNAAGQEQIRGFYLAKLGTDEKVAKITKDCATP